MPFNVIYNVQKLVISASFFVFLSIEIANGNPKKGEAYNSDSNYN